MYVLILLYVCWLQARLDEEFDNLPVPLLKAHADKLLAEG
jgi:hypothetical protein